MNDADHAAADPDSHPDSAPFSAEQRTWLNGFFAGLLSLDGGVNALSSEETAALMNEVMGTGATTARGPLDDGDDGQTPWHDPGLPIGDRMQLAESRPLRRRFMAAMGQQDCGQCGYNCEDYANAIALKNEERLNLCVPGGKETTRMLKTLYAEFGAIPATAKAPAAAPDPRRHGRRADADARQSGRGDIPLAHPSQQAGFAERNLAYRYRPGAERN